MTRMIVAIWLVAWWIGTTTASAGLPLRGTPAPTTRPADRSAESVEARSRRIEVTCTATVDDIPTGASRVDLWLPVPSPDAQQSVGEVHVDTSLAHEWSVDAQYGNRVLHCWSREPRAPIAATVRYAVDRRAEQALPSGSAANVSRDPQPSPRDLQPDRLGIIDDRVRALAAEVTAGKSDTVSRARAVYDYVIAHMSYDKVAPGWGKGDTARACEIGKGNCTDFHALFISLARASGIPARFGIGYCVPPKKSQGVITGYHCWAEFWLPGSGWVPVDASEAKQDPERREFYFGSLDVDRFRVSVGRDVALPGLHGKPLNYLLSPIAEADGKPLKAQKTVSFQQGQ